MVLSISHIIQLCGFAALMSCGQILFKVSAMTIPALSVTGMTSLLTNIWFFLAMALYGAATLLWIIILKQVPLSLAYPFVALGFVIIPIISHFFFAEPINLYYILGVLLIIAGLGVIVTMAPR